MRTFPRFGAKRFASTVRATPVLESTVCPESNSIGNLLLHLEGSTRGWIINTAGGAENPRNRQQEFDEREHISASELQFGSLSWKSSKTRRCRPSDSCQRVARSQRSSEPSRYAQPAHLSVPRLLLATYLDPIRSPLFRGNCLILKSTCRRRPY